MPLVGSVITKKLPGNVETCAHVVPTLHLLPSYATACLTTPWDLKLFIFFLLHEKFD